MARQRRGKTNPQLVGLITQLKTLAREQESGLWRKVALRLEGPARNWAEVNLHHLDRHSSDGGVIVVPGKVLSSGALGKKLTVAAWSFSERAKEKIEEAGGKALTLTQLSDSHPRGSGVTIIG